MYFRVPTNSIFMTHIIMAVVCFFGCRLNAARAESLAPASYKELIERGRETESPDGQFITSTRHSLSARMIPQLLRNAV